MDNLWPWLALGGLVVFVIILNLGLISALRRKPRRPGALERGLQAFTAGRDSADKQQRDLDELHRRVADLRTPNE